MVVCSSTSHLGSSIIPIVVQDSLPYGNDWMGTLADNPEDWLFTPSMRELLEKDGPGASACVIAGNGTVAAATVAEPAETPDLELKDFIFQVLSKPVQVHLTFHFQHCVCAAERFQDTKGSAPREPVAFPEFPGVDGEDVYVTRRGQLSTCQEGKGQRGRKPQAAVKSKAQADVLHRSTGHIKELQEGLEVLPESAAGILKGSAELPKAEQEEIHCRGTLGYIMAQRKMPADWAQPKRTGEDDHGCEPEAKKMRTSQETGGEEPKAEAKGKVSEKDGEERENAEEPVPKAKAQAKAKGKAFEKDAGEREKPQEPAPKAKAEEPVPKAKAKAKAKGKASEKDAEEDEKPQEPAPKAKAKGKGKASEKDGEERENAEEPAPKAKAKAKGKASEKDAEEREKVEEPAPKAKAKAKGKASEKDAEEREKPEEPAPKAKAKAKGRAKRDAADNVNEAARPAAKKRARQSGALEGAEPRVNVTLRAPELPVGVQFPENLRLDTYEQVFNVLNLCAKSGSIGMKGKHEHVSKEDGKGIGFEGDSNFRLSVYWSRAAVGIKRIVPDGPGHQMCYFARHTPCTCTNIIMANIWAP